jgi:cobalt-zinc-cadmium efflux system membrane fusion protein
MRARMLPLLLTLFAIGFLACAEREPAPAERAEAAASSDRLCAEHGVLEAVCTKCNPKLAPVFQAKGDWCDEHGFPESFCPICHPERGGRPAANVGSNDEPPADRLKVRLASPKTFEIAGIDTEKGRPITGIDGFIVPARLVYDAGRRAEINARSAGVVREVLVDVGSRVREGAPLVVLDSPEVGADRSRLNAARANVDVAKAQLDRVRALFAEGIAPQREVQIAESELAAARAEVQALEAAGGVVGLGEASGRYTLRAPLAGVVVRRAATIGRQVDPEEVLLEIVDASILWAELDVPEPRLGEIAVGREATLTFDALPGRSFRGSIVSIAPEVDPHTRTATVRVRLVNKDGVLRANMYGRARIQTGGAAAGVEVPRAALQRANGADVVFVRLTDTLYETRRVETGMRTDGWVEITRGIAPGEDVVTVGSFLLKTETLKGSIGAGCCEVK